MDKRVISFLLTVIVGVSSGSLTGCGGNTANTAPSQIASIDNSLAQQPAIQPPMEQQTVIAPTVAEAPSSTAKKTTTKKKTTAKTATTGTKTTAKTATTAATATKTTTAPTAAGSNLSVVQKLVNKVRDTYKGVTSYTATVTLFTKKYEKVAPKSAPITSAESKYTFQAPRNEAFIIQKHNNSLLVGAKMVWKGEQTAKVKAGGVLGLFPMDMSITDYKLTTNRGWSMDKLDHEGILSRALDPKSQLTLVGKSNINGKEAFMIKVKGSGLDDAVTEETIAIDAKTYMIIANEVYSGEELVFQSKINIESINPSVPAGTFEL